MTEDVVRASIGVANVGTTVSFRTVGRVLPKNCGDLLLAPEKNMYHDADSRCLYDVSRYCDSGFLSIPLDTIIFM